MVDGYVRVPKYCQIKGSNRAYSRDPRNGGKKIYFGVYGTEESKQLYAAWVAELLLDKGEPPSLLTLGDIAAMYCTHLEQEKRSKRDRNHAAIARKHLTCVAGDLKASAMGPRVLLKLQRHLKTVAARGGESGEPLSRQYINKIVAEVKRMVRWACTEEYMPPETYSKLQPLQSLRRSPDLRESNTIAAVSWNTVKATLPFLNETVRTMVQVQFLCGMRPGEVCKMRKEWIDRTGSVWLYTPKEHKNAHRLQDLVKGIPEPAQKLLKPYLTDSEHQWAFLATDRAGKVHGAYSNFSYRQAVRRAIVRANAAGVKIPDWNPGQLRHSIATEIRTHFDQEAVQTYLGHSNIETAKIYAEKTRKAVILLTEKLNEKLFQPLFESSQQEGAASNSSEAPAKLPESEDLPNRSLENGVEHAGFNIPNPGRHYPGSGG